jgi:hypothetical protein
VLGALAAIPGVETAASANFLLPLRGGGLSSTVTLPDDDATAHAGRAARYVGVTPNFFEALGIPLQRGRSFAENGEGHRSAVVSEAFARELWPNENPVGRVFRLEADAERGWVTVVGVSRDVLTWDSSGEKPLPVAYLDLESFPVRPLFFFVRHRSDAPAIGADTISRAIDALGLPVVRIVVTPMEQVTPEELVGRQVFRENNCFFCHEDDIQASFSTSNNGLDEVFTDPGSGDGHFRTASLRNVAFTAPYMHDGRFATLREVVDHYNDGVSNSPHLARLLQDGNGGPRKMNLTEVQKEGLIAFLHAMTDEQFLRDPRFSDPFQ